MKRTAAFLLCLMLLLATMPFGVSVAQEVPTVKAQTLTVEQLKAKYPHGAYWNHTKGGSEDYTWTACTHHVGSCSYSGSCGCNTYKNVALQCMGFAYQLASLAYGGDPRADWSTNRNASALDSLKAGDIVRYRWNGHSIFVLAVEGDTVTYADCNWDGHCGIRWDATISKDKLKASFTYVKVSPFALEYMPPAEALTVNYHGGEGQIDNTVVGHTYRVLSTNGLNMRQDAGTQHAVVTALPHGTAFTVAVGETKEVGGYTWGKTTYNGKTGWLVISDFVEKIGDLWEKAWRLSEGMVCGADGTLLTHTLAYGEAIESLCAPEEIGLYREGYRFGGWCTAADGTGVVFAAGMTPEELYADGDTVVLYALWNPIIPGDVDGDGQRNNRDLARLQQHINGWEVTVTEDADVNGDGEVNNRDVALLQQLLNGWDVAPEAEWKEKVG